MPAQIIAPANVKVGEKFSISGTGWGWRYYVNITLDGPKIITTPLVTVKTTNSKGAFTAIVTIPKVDVSGVAIAAGAYTLHAASRRPARARTAIQVGSPLPPPVDPPPVDPPPTGIPPIGPKPANSLLHKDFADGLLFPFVEQVYPNDHPYVPGNGQYMSQYCRYAKDAAHISVHDGYLDLRCTKGSPFWTAGFVATFEAPGAWPPVPTFTFQYGLSEVCAAIDAGTGSQNAAWPGPWYLDPKTSQEIDWVERITGRDTANVRPGPAQPVSSPPVDTGWHVFGLLREAAKLTFYLDGAVVGTKVQSLNAPMSLLADSKVGLTDPNTGATPDVVRMRVAWWKVRSL